MITILLTILSSLKIWGIVEADGKKLLVKRATVTTKDGKSASIRQVFDYAPLDT